MLAHHLGCPEIGGFRLGCALPVCAVKHDGVCLCLCVCARARIRCQCALSNMTEPIETHGCTGISLFAVHLPLAMTAEELLLEQPKAERVEMLDGIGLLVCVDTSTHTCARTLSPDTYMFTHPYEALRCSIAALCCAACVALPVLRRRLLHPLPCRHSLQCTKRLRCKQSLTA